MSARTFVFIAFALSTLVVLAACATLLRSPPMVSQLQGISAGHTGCPPEDIRISNVKLHPPLGDTMTWNATCNARTYLCSSVGRSDSCAPVAH
jgi:hypothetical protein